MMDEELVDFIEEIGCAFVLQDRLIRNAGEGLDDASGTDRKIISLVASLAIGA